MERFTLHLRRRSEPNRPLVVTPLRRARSRTSGAISCRRSLLLPAVLAFVSTLASCGFAHVEITQSLGEGPRYSRVAIEKILVRSYEKNPDATRLNERFTKLAEQLLTTALGKRYTLVDRSQAGGPATLVVNVQIDIQYGNRGLRYAGVGGAGAVDSILTASDGATGVVQLQVASKSDLVMGLFGGDMSWTVEDNIHALVEKSGLGGG
jgi:hypothetical protein